jgi:hypothetical protein
MPETCRVSCIKTKIQWHLVGYLYIRLIVSCLNVLSLFVSVALKSSCDLVCLWKLVISHFSFLWRFDPIQSLGLPLRGFTVTPIGHTTLGRTPQDEWLAETSTWQYRTLARDKHACPGGVRTHSPNKRAAMDNALDQHWFLIVYQVDKER